MEPDQQIVEKPATTVKFDLADELSMNKYDERRKRVAGRSLSILRGDHPSPLVRVLDPRGLHDERKMKVILPGMSHEALTPRGLMDGILNGSQKVGEWGSFIRVENAGSPAANRTVRIDMHPTLAGEALVRCTKELGLNIDDALDVRNNPNVDPGYLKLLKTESKPYVS